MNKRKKKKLAKKQELFAISFASSYREVKELDRAYHEFCLMSQRRQRAGHYLLDTLEWGNDADTWRKANDETTVT